MKNFLVTAFVFAGTTLGLSGTESATAQNAILAEMYGRGVHSYYAGNSDDAYQYLSMAIDNGIQDPRAYYFRGIVAQASGRPYAAETDWQTGAEMEASGRTNGAIGRSLARFQGAARIKLEEIRQRAKLTALATAMSRSKQRYGEIDAAQGAASAVPPAPTIVPPTAAPAPAPAPAPAAPAAASNDDPFADNMAEGKANVVADDALEGAFDNPFADDGTAGGGGAAPAADTNPFGGGGDAGGADPFGGGAGGADPFGGGGDAGAGAGDDPFGGAADDDPFGN